MAAFAVQYSFLGSLPILVVLSGSSPITDPRHLQKHAWSKGPSLHRHYPASPVLWPSPTPTGCASPRLWSQSSTPMGLPRYPHHLCDVPCPLPRRTGWRLSTPSAIRTAFPDPGGSASATALSRPAQASLALWPTASLGRPRRPLSRGFDPASVPATPLVSFRSYRLLSGWNPPPQVIRALVAHQDARGPM